MTSRIDNETLHNELNELTFGIEIETINHNGRMATARAIQSVVGGYDITRDYNGCYDRHIVVAADGRRWTVMGDSSIDAPAHARCEIVSPVLTYSDIPTLQEVIRSVRRAGCRTHSSCGIHIHVGVQNWTVKQVSNLVKIVNKQEDLLFAAFGTGAARQARWCKPVRSDVVDAVSGRNAAKTFDDLNKAWYGQTDWNGEPRVNTRPSHYDNSRYHGLNLHNVWFRGTIEFRYFDSSLHAGQIKSWLQFIGALCVRARRARAASAAKRTLDPTRVVYDVRVFCLDLGLSGDEFKTARRFLFGDLSPIAGRGNAARRCAA